MVLSGGRASTSWLRVAGHATHNATALALSAVRIGTGRRHQIRAQTAHVGHPTVSDGPAAHVRSSKMEPFRSIFHGRDLSGRSAVV